MKGANNPKNAPIEQWRSRVVTSLALARTEFHVIGLRVSYHQKLTLMPTEQLRT
jgi:hypothetical protein